MFTKIVALYTAFVILLGNFALIGESKIPNPSTAEQLLSLESVIEKKEIADEIFAVSMNGYTYEEKMTAFALQGIVAKKNPCIYFLTTGADGDYLNEIKSAGKTITYVNWTLSQLIERFKSYIGDSGYVLYRESEYGEGLNVAVNYATVYGWLPVQKSTEALVKVLGLTKKLDISEDEYDYDFQLTHWKFLRDNFRKGLVIHQKYSKPGLRDFAIQQNVYCFYTDSTNEGNRYLKKILKWSGKNTSIQGWVEMEKHFVEFISKLGCYITPSDICWNNSILASVETEIPQQKKDEPIAYKDSSKHYITLVYSDGDNCQWIQNGFNECRSSMRKYPETKMTWTISPFLSEFCPLALKVIYNNSNSNQYFASGPSGIAYCNPTCYDSQSLDLMSTRTASVMLKSNQRILTILDDYSNIKDKKLAYRLGYFSRFDNIDGGILFLDPDKYQCGGGKVWFSDDKPFVSVRLSLWADNGYDGATDEWINSKAEIINNYPVDINSVDGYSVVCIHAWSMTPDSIQKFISQLDEHVEILNADDFLKTIQENIPHKNAAPNK